MRMRMDEHFEYFFPYLFLIDFTNKSRIKILCNISLLEILLRLISSFLKRNEIEIS